MKSLLLSTLLLTGCATADYVQMADVATTAIAIDGGLAVEGNPVWGGASWPVIAVVKLGVTQAVKLTPAEYCEPGLFALTLGGSGAALWNIGVMAGSGPAALPLVALLWAWQWDDWQQDAVKDCKTNIFTGLNQ